MLIENLKEEIKTWNIADALNFLGLIVAIFVGIPSWFYGIKAIALSSSLIAIIGLAQVLFLRIGMRKK